MKFQNVLVLFTTGVSATAPPTCKGSSPSFCKYTSNRDANECKRLFVKSYINVATCQLPAKTVTSTRTSCVTSVITKTLAPPPTTTKVYTTITKTGKPITLPTITVTATSTKIDTTVVTDSTTTVELHTTTKIETVRVTDVKSVTSTATSTTTVPFVFEAPVCTRKRARAARALPTSCSCFLTTTKPAATKTATVTKNKPAVTRVVYKVGGPRKVIRRTVTIIRYKAGPTLSAPETTKTSTTTITQTDRTLTTITDSQTTTATETEDIFETITQTKTESALATATADPCDNVGSTEPIRQQISGSPIEVTFSNDANGPNAT
ncbi:uncharacterized protein FTOL_04183 [Fusarium torulosum]|uniref:Uncharacterized protein n=1 Tax=Fusarium torulosum TaxID=33205 RepID=A0AAE8M5D0_9HYPO|nr:uncharacterized protein FTOL_04183 [Fusarium torulosum]